MRIISSDAVILRHIDYGESDRIVSFLTPEHGRLKGFARAARKSRKRFGAALDSFSQVVLYWTPSASGEMVSLKEAELVDLRSGLRNDLAAIALAGYGCELVEEFLGEHQTYSQVYYLLQALLDHLASHGGSIDVRLLLELRMLVLAGYTPHFLHCSECGGGLEGERVGFDLDRGGSLCPLCCPPGFAANQISLPTLGTLARILQGPPTLFEGFRFGARTLNEAGPILSKALCSHLLRPLKSQTFLDQVLPAPDRG